ncbi:hypothetical protein [Novipirellula artificiosorum]|uniref:Uncharacterized protein n=1 Tax=Novipirellula artificiosorum TaxID=2528016 RepID=A0A5C6DCB8_9BACT|nr:hypothetical protein [Novipirellula artificiosorum]TWU33875.1 hypothetical protein Poly41_48750 [Novipirellula artificiosorum]
MLPFLQQQLLTVTAQEFQRVRDSLEEHKSKFIADYWETTKKSDSSALRFHAACALATYDPSIAYWENEDFCQFLTEQLVNVPPADLPDCHGSFKSYSKNFCDCVHSLFHRLVVFRKGRRSIDRSHVRILSDVGDHVIAIQVIHKRDDPKLPYQAVMIRQSATHRKGRDAAADEGGVDPHTGLGSIPRFNCIGFVYLIVVDS